MGCCIAIAYVIALVRTGLARLAGRDRAPAELGFPPAAYRSAPVRADSNEAAHDLSELPDVRERSAA